MLVIQDPTDPQSTFLLESLLDAFRSAEQISGVFAFASSRGVELFTGDEAFREVAKDHPVELIVGIDAITNIRALDRLSAVSRKFPNVTARAFLNPRREGLFHPKFCWTRKRVGGHLIVGSGNLTESGLLGNWEAYSTEELDQQAVDVVATAWDEWKARHAGSLVSLDDERVRALANANNVLAREGDLPTLVAPPLRGEEPATTQVIPDNAAVLIADIPDNNNRSTQANFHKADYEEYFGAKDGRLVVFRLVKADGTMADYERDRPPVTVKSRNFRFELSALRGIAYPNVNTGRPIGVFIRIATRTFFYHFLLPGDPQYSTVAAILQKATGRPTPTAGSKMRSIRVTVNDLREQWPAAPFWGLPGPI